MKIKLLDYTFPTEYGKLFESNLVSINEISNDENLIKLITILSDSTKIEKEIIFLDFKRFLMTSAEYRRTRLYRWYWNYLTICVTFLKLAIRMFKKYNLNKSDIIIDDWSIGVVDDFYEKEFISRAKNLFSCSVLDFGKIFKINLIDGIKCSKGFITSYFYGLYLSSMYKMNIAYYVCRFFSDYLSGLWIKKNLKPKIVVSGNDNGLNLIRTKAAGAKVVLIQNGNRPPWSDSCFLYADCYFSMYGEKTNKIRINMTKCLFKKVYSFGSIRLHNYYKKQAEDKYCYDLLYVSTVGNSDQEKDHDNMLGHYCTLKSEYEAIRLFNDNIAKKNKYKIAYYCRYYGEETELKSMGLHSDHIEYISYKPGYVYNFIAKSEIVCSTCSTACLEAMSMGKKIVFINLSGNNYLNYYYKDLEIEYNKNVTIALDEFLEEIKNRKFNYEDYIVQNPKYIDDVIMCIAQILDDKNNNFTNRNVTNPAINNLNKFYS